MAAKIIMFEQPARDKILKGVNIMADAVKSVWVPEAATRFWRNPGARPTSPRTV